MPSPRAVRSAILAVLWVTNAAMAQEAYEGDQKEGRWGKVLDRIVDGGHCGVQHHQRGTGKVFKGHGHKRKWWANKAFSGTGGPVANRTRNDGDDACLGQKRWCKRTKENNSC